MPRAASASTADHHEADRSELQKFLKALDGPPGRGYNFWFISRRR